MNSLLFYIGNGVLKCALSRKSSGQTPEVLFWEEMAVSHPEIINTKALGEQVLRALDKLAKNCREVLFKSNLSNKKIDKIFYIIASPWYLSETKTLVAEKLEDFLIKEETVNEMVSVVNFSNHPQFSNEVVPLEKKIIQISLNGYATSSPFGKKAKKLEVSVVESFIDKTFFQSIEDVVGKYFQAKEEHSHSLALASFSVLRNIFNEKEDFLLINVSSLLSEISLIKNGILYETVSMPMGTDKVLESLKSNLNLSTAAALSVARLYQDNKLEAGLKEKVDHILEEFKKEWLPKIREVFTHLSLGLSIPSSCFFLSPPNFTGLFSGLLDSEEYTQFSFHDGKFKVESLTESSFQKYIKFDSKEVDSTIAIMALFASINK